MGKGNLAKKKKTVPAKSGSSTIKNLYGAGTPDEGLKTVPAIGFAGYSGSGKTTVIEALIPFLKEKGLRLAVIKHDAHGIDVDREGKDSWRFTEAGAEMSIVSGPEKTAVIEKREVGLEQLFTMVHDVDLILVEGYKNEPLSQIGICRKENGKGFTDALDRFEAVVTDLEGSELVQAIVSAKEAAEAGGRKVADKNVPMCGFEDMKDLADYIVQNMDGFRKVRIG